MPLLVSREGGRVIEGLVAVAACVLPLPGSAPLLWSGRVEEHTDRLLWLEHLHLLRLNVHVLAVLVGLVVSRQGGRVVEALVAVRTAVGLASGVHQLVLLQVTLAHKALPALVALVGLLARVNPGVFSQGGGRRKALATLQASVGLVPSVGLLMCLEIGGGGEAFPTQRAAEGFLSGVHLLVLLEVAAADEALPALGALVWLVVRVHLHVLAQGDGGGEAFAALGASVGLVRRVHHGVRLQVEGIDAHFPHQLHPRGHVTLLLHVDLHVCLQAGVHGEAFPTVNAYVWVGGFVDLKVLMKICDATEDFSTFIAL